MFYSQFILARKGPLGTIWIAAHLERKLRKNQVADTDIGESVDSILFPDVPIALRLSSHLLLGVVRIYSRKVNYLFHDCSETLLKVRHAFRSTAVDLPPEESTAPYHSITLPETFDLDDFELPDTALLSGNFVDHHISAREQITLQDNVGASGYSISQFGSDERFGDGDASQIGLNLDEDIVLDKESSLPDNLLEPEGTEHYTPLHNEENCPNMEAEGPETNTEEQHIAGTLGKVQDISDLTESQLLDTSENAQTPGTPALIQEAIPANFEKASPSIDAEAILTNPSRLQTDSECHISNESGELKDKHELEAAGLRMDADKLNSVSTLQRCTSGLDQDTNADPPLQVPVMDASEFPEVGDQSQETALSKSSRVEVNCSASSDYPEPEKMLSAVGEGEGVAKDLEDLRPLADKGVMESDGSVDRGISTRGMKRQVTENSPRLIGSFGKSSRASKSRRKVKNIHNDDDVLASILVGRSSLKLKSTPSISTTPPLKRQRQTPKTGVTKRKTLLDETMVLLPDAIREQLINTEDIRRTRRKAPCTRPEIWMIEKCILEERIFCEPILSGLPAELAGLHDQTFDLNDAPDPEFNADHPLSEASEAKNSDIRDKTENQVEDDSKKEEIPVSDDVGGEAPPTSPVAQHLSEAPAVTSPSNIEGSEVNDKEPAEVDHDVPTNPVESHPEGVLAESTVDQSQWLTEALTGASETDLVENPSTVGENSGCHDEMDLERSQLFDSAAPKDSNDFCSAVRGNDTGFLIADDDEADFEEVENEEPDAEEAQSTENSGWSARTKGVARFLKNLFVDVDETRQGGAAVAVDRLLAGKTRKEASRMFFETLVLSTKEFILVDQEGSFENINIRPMSKLLKSEF
ncbi:sister chromatid cohesion 1 protein 4 [Wolffia australiana]